MHQGTPKNSRGQRARASPAPVITAAPRPLQGPVLLTARDAEPASAPYIPIHFFTSFPLSGQPSPLIFFPLLRSIGIFGQGDRVNPASGTPINSPRMESRGLQSLGGWREEGAEGPAYPSRGSRQTNHAYASASGGTSHIT